MKTTIIALAIAVALLFQGAFVARLEAQTNPPAGMTQQQFDALVEAISNSVTEKLKAEGAQAAPAATAPASSAATPAASDSKGSKASKPPPGPKIVKMPPKEGPDSFTVFFERADGVLKATPVMLGQLGSIPGRLDRTAQGGRSAGSFLLLLGVIAAVAVATEAMLRQVWSFRAAGWPRRSRRSSAGSRLPAWPRWRRSTGLASWWSGWSAMPRPARGSRAAPPRTGSQSPC